MKRVVFLFLGLCSFPGASNAQNIQISGIPNHYLRVDEVQADRVRVTDVAGGQLGAFQVENKVLLIQMTGGKLNTPPNFLTLESRTRESFYNTGSYEILQVDQVIPINATEAWIVFTDNIGKTYDAGEKIQLVRFAEGETVSTSGAVTAMDWNGAVGGIVAIIGTDSVKLSHNIDVSNKGFRGGAVPSENYTGGCRYGQSSSIKDTLYFLPSQLNRSGNKGEGVITATWPYTKGTGFALNGGGAGNGLYSGGGGGSNYYVGGDGGRQSPTCNLPYVALGGWGGYGCKDIYDFGRIIMGGGGGSGSKLSTSTPSKGGDGGCIIMIITGILAGNGNTLHAQGESATATTGSGGGGGAGGTVMLDVTGYSTALNINVRGGRGGNTTDANCTGSGGGGSGGVIWYSGSSTSATLDITNGLSGSVGPGCSSVPGIPGNPGSTGKELANLLTPLTGFLFNSIRGTDTICAGQVPNTLTASQPKGGDGTYVYAWEQSIDNINWSSAVGTKTLRTLQPPALTQTTWFRRVVTSNFIFDTSRVIQVYVYPAIGNNTIGGTDTICYNKHAASLSGTSPTGGNGTYQYLWQYSTDQSVWSDDGTTNPHDPGILQQSRYYRRMVTSAVYCSHTSNTVRITVLPSITNNAFVTPDTVLCENQGPGPLNARSPAGGDGIYAYHWEKRSATGNWTGIPSSNMMRYNPGILTDTTLYRRIVYSGNGSACTDTSSTAKTINVLPALANNLLSSASNRYCAGEIPVPITGGQPSGGDGAYHYLWRTRTSGNWQDIPGADQVNYTPVDPVEVNTSFSRVVTSGDYNACRDTSASFALVVVPYITNTLGLADQTICQFNTPSPLTAPTAGGGLGGITYQWIQKQAGAGTWTNATGTGNQSGYTPGALTISTLYARMAFSDICSDTSDTVSITVYPVITGNNVVGAAVQYTCYDTPLALSGSQPADGNGTYAYQWQQSSDNVSWTSVTVNSGTDRDYLSPNLTSAMYFRRLVYSSPQNHECSDISDAVEVRINPLPLGDVISDTDTLCEGETLYVKFNLSGNGPFNVTIGGLSSQTRNGVGSSPDSIAFVPASSGQYTMYAVEDDSGCFAAVNGFTGIAEVVVYEVPAANPGSNDVVCSDTYPLKAVKSVAGSSGLWSGTGVTFSDATDPNSNVTSDSYVTRVMTWTETNWHCTDAGDVEITFFEQPPAADAGPDQTLDFIFTAQLQAVPPVIGSGQWSVVSGGGEFNNDTLPDAVISELKEASSLR